MARRMTQHTPTTDEPLLDPLKVRLPKELLDRIDQYRLSLPLRPTRSQIVRFLLEHAMNIIEER